MYEFNRETDQNIRVYDGGCAHYSLSEIPMVKGDAAMLTILDPSKTMEEKLAAKRKITETFVSMIPPLSEEVSAKVTIDEIDVPGLNDDDPEIRCLVITPKDLPRRKVPGLIYFYAGGLVFGAPEMNLPHMVNFAIEHGCVVIGPNYRCLPQFGYPAPADDAEAVTNYILEHADELRISTKRLVVAGMSAGGYMAAVASARMKMRGGFQYAGQVMAYPMLDDGCMFPSSNIYFADLWHSYDDQVVFQALLGPNYNRAAAPADAIPLHLKDFSGMPPTVIISGDCDYGHDAVMAYAQGIMNEGIFCGLHVFGGGFHGFLGMDRNADIVQRGLRAFSEGLGDLMSGKCVRG